MILDECDRRNRSFTLLILIYSFSDLIFTHAEQSNHSHIEYITLKRGVERKIPSSFFHAVVVMLGKLKLSLKLSEQD